MALNSAINSWILLVFSTNLITECEDYGFFCSRVRTYRFSQFYRMIVNEYLSSVLRLLSNLSYMIFSINRLSLIGREHGKFVTYVSKLSVKKFFAWCLMPCGVLSISRLFRFIPNSLQPDASYPYPLVHYFGRINRDLVFAYLAFDFIFSFVNNILFLLVNFILDIILAVLLRQALKEKEKKLIDLNVVVVSNKNG